MEPFLLHTEFTGLECTSELDKQFKFNKYSLHVYNMPKTVLEHSNSMLVAKITIMMMILINNSYSVHKYVPGIVLNASVGGFKCLFIYLFIYLAAPGLS